MWQREFIEVEISGVTLVERQIMQDVRRFFFLAWQTPHR